MANEKYTYSNGFFDTQMAKSRQSASIMVPKLWNLPRRAVKKLMSPQLRHYVKKLVPAL